MTDDGAVYVGFELAGDADVRPYRRCLDYRLQASW